MARKPWHIGSLSPETCTGAAGPNMLRAEDEVLARDLYEAALRRRADLMSWYWPHTQQDAVQSLGCAWAGEIFADRAYNDDARR